jgi:hypothetical protein
MLLPVFVVKILLGKSAESILSCANIQQPIRLNSKLTNDQPQPPEDRILRARV